MLMGARQSLWRGGKLSARSYVQSGLIAQWDGIENAGYGKHDPNAKVWKDLIGSYDLNLDGVSFDEKGIGKTTWAQGNGTVHGVRNFDEALILFQNKNFTLELTMSPTPFDVSSTYKFFADFQSNFVRWAYRRGLNDVYGSFTGRVASGFALPSNEIIKHLAFAVQKDDVVRSANSEIIHDGRSVYDKIGDITSVGRLTLLNSFAGTFYGVRLYDKCLTDHEIAQNYAIDKERFNI